MLGDATADAVRTAILEAAQAADASKVQGTPSFELGYTGGQVHMFQPANLSTATFASVIDTLLRCESG